MTCRVCLLAGVMVLGSRAGALTQDPGPGAPKKLADGVYAVRRDGPAEKDVRPLRQGEVLAVDRHRYAKEDAKEPPRYLVVGSDPDVPLDLAAEPTAEKDGADTVRVLVKLKPPAAEALARLTRDRPGRQLAVVIGGEVVTVHKVRAAITGGEVQITSCAPGGPEYLLEQLRSRRAGR
jgi:preprotein translocase subunit SecD